MAEDTPKWKQLEEETKANMAKKNAPDTSYWGSVKDTLQGYKDRAVNAMTPAVVDTIRQRQQAVQQQLDDADQGKAKGGKVKHKAKAKAKHRGDGKAERGHTKGRHI